MEASFSSGTTCYELINGQLVKTIAMDNVSTRNDHRGFSYKISDPLTHETKGFLQGTLNLLNYTYEPDPKVRDIFERSKCLVVANKNDHFIQGIWKFVTSPELRLAVKEVILNIDNIATGVESKLIEMAEKAKKNILELDTYEESDKLGKKAAKALYDLGEGSPAYTEYVKTMIAIINDLIFAYRNGSKQEIKKAVFSPLSVDYVADRYQKNVKTAAKIDTLLRQNQGPLFAISIQYLYKEKKGEGGLIALLKERGWQITRILDEYEVDYLSPSNPKSLERLIAQNFSIDKRASQMVQDGAIITSKAIVDASYRISAVQLLGLLIKSVVFNEEDPQFSFYTVLKDFHLGSSDANELLLIKLADKVSNISFSCISVCLDRALPENLILKLLDKCNELKTRSLDIKRSLQGNYSDKLIMRLLNSSNGAVVTAAHIELLQNRNVLHQSLQQFANNSLKSSEEGKSNTLKSNLLNKYSSNDLIPLFMKKIKDSEREAALKLLK